MTQTNLNAAMSAEEQVTFFRDAARQTVACFFAEDEKGLRNCIGYLVRCLENGATTSETAQGATRNPC